MGLTIIEVTDSSYTAAWDVVAGADVYKSEIAKNTTSLIGIRELKSTLNVC